MKRMSHFPNQLNQLYHYGQMLHQAAPYYLEQQKQQQQQQHKEKEEQPIMIYWASCGPCHATLKELKTMRDKRGVPLIKRIKLLEKDADAAEIRSYGIGNIGYPSIYYNGQLSSGMEDVLRIVSDYAK